MADLRFSPIAVEPRLLTGPAAPPSAAELAKRGQIRETAEKFEASFLSVMLQPMFEGVDPNDPFGGGAGEQMFRSVMTEAMGKQMVKSGGVGVADVVQREMLKLQGLS